jgi:large subunit ribosomal protein L19
MGTKSADKVKSGSSIPSLSPGDTVKVSFKVKEATRERFQTFNGLVIKVKKGNSGGNFTIRRVSSGIGVEHTFPFASPLLEKVEVVRHGKVRRAKLYYMRGLSAKEARLKERRDRATGIVISQQASDIEEVAAQETVEVEEVVAQETVEAEEVVTQQASDIEEVTEQKTGEAEEVVVKQASDVEEVAVQETTETEKVVAQDTNEAE